MRIHPGLFWVYTFLLMLLLSACSHSTAVVDGDTVDGDEDQAADGDPEIEVDGDIDPLADGDMASDGDVEKEIAPNPAAIYGELRAPVEAGGHGSYFELYDEEPIIGAVPNGSMPLSVVSDNPPSVPIDGGVAYAFKFQPLSSGSYWIRGGVDLNDDGDFILEDGEFAFAADHPYVLSPGQVIDDARIYMGYEDAERGSISGTVTIPERYDGLSYSVMIFDHEVNINTVLDDKPVAVAEMTSGESTLDYRIINLAGGSYYLYTAVDPCEGTAVEDVRVGLAYAGNPLLVDIEGEKDFSGKDLDYSAVNLGCPGVPQGRLCGSVRAPSDYATMTHSVMLFDQAPGENVFSIRTDMLANSVDEGDGSFSFPFCFDYLAAGDYWMIVLFDKNRNEAMNPENGELAYYGAPPYHLSEGQEKTLAPSFFDFQNPELGRIAGTILTRGEYPRSSGYAYNVCASDLPPEHGMQPNQFFCTIAHAPDSQNPEVLAYEISSIPFGKYYVVIVLEACVGPGLGITPFRHLIDYPANPIDITAEDQDHLDLNYDLSDTELPCSVSGEVWGELRIGAGQAITAEPLIWLIKPSELFDMPLANRTHQYYAIYTDEIHEEDGSTTLGFGFYVKRDTDRVDAVTGATGNVPAGQYMVFAELDLNNDFQYNHTTELRVHSNSLLTAVPDQTSNISPIYYDHSNPDLAAIEGTITVPAGHLEDALYYAFLFEEDPALKAEAIPVTFVLADGGGGVPNTLQYRIQNLSAGSYFLAGYAVTCDGTGSWQSGPVHADNPFVLDQQNNSLSADLDFRDMDLSCPSSR